MVERNDDGGESSPCSTVVEQVDDRMLSSSDQKKKQRQARRVTATVVTSSDKRKRRRRPSSSSTLERAAASRTLRGDGGNDSLPPLPTRAGVDTASTAPHPYGVLPCGNRLLSTVPDCRRALRGPWRRLNDEQTLDILGFCTGPELGRLVRSCRYLYVLGHTEELWRDLVLRRGDVLSSFHGTWRNTYVRHHTPSSPTIVRHVPMAMPGMFSDTLYRSYLCSAFRFDPSIFYYHDDTMTAHDHTPQIKDSNKKHNKKQPHKDKKRPQQKSNDSINHVARRDNRVLDAKDFVSDFESANIPCVLTHVTVEAHTKWKDATYLTSTVGDAVSFRATSGAAPLPAEFTLRGYSDYCRGAAYRHEEAPLYLFDRTFDTKVPQLVRDYQTGLRSSCAFFNPADPEHHHDLLRHLGPDRRPDYRWIIMGPSTSISGSSFHLDPNATHAWNLPVRGTKYWIFYPPGVPPPGVVPSPNGDDVAMPLSLGEWFLTYWDEHVRRRRGLNKEDRPLECLVRPGELLFVPHGWWHLVLNVVSSSDDDDMSIALTQNYVSERNLSDVIRFCKTRQQQISGCRDREEAVPPERLYADFKESFCTASDDNGHGSSSSNTAVWERAERKSDEGWTCAAWKDEEDDAGSVAAMSHTKKKKTSILERAKMPTVSESNTSTTNDNSGGFTFSFL